MPDPYEIQHAHIIGEYRLLQKLGGGGFSTVHLAEHIHDHSQVAIKILQVPLTKSEDFRDFINEVRTTRLHHPHIVPLLDFGLSRDDLPFLVMEYAPAGTLRDRHPKGFQVPLATVVEYTEQIASALQHAHDCRVIHRDVKPANMLLRSDGTLLLSDFGIAKIIEQTTLMSMQSQIGTPAYMAPEQLKGYPCFASDQYSLAIVVYEWITGTRPFQGNPLGLAIQHMTALPPSLQKHLPALPSNIEQVIFKALSKAPEERFASVQEFATALHAAVQRATISRINTQNLTFVETPSKEVLIPKPGVTAPLRTEPQTNTPPASQSLIVNQPITPQVTQTRQAPAQTNNPPSSNLLYTNPTTYAPQHVPTLPPIAAARAPTKAGKAFRQFSPSRRNLLLLGGASLTGLLTLAFVINTGKLQNPSKGSNPDHTPSSGHPTPTVPALDANSVSRLVNKWTFQTGDMVESSPTVVDNVVYIGSDDGNVYAIDARSGLQKWAFHTGDKVTSSPTVVNGVVYIGSLDSNVYAIDARSGVQKWACQTGKGVTSRPMVVGGVVYVGSLDNNVYAIDALSGMQKWAFPTGDCVYSSPAVVSNVVYVGSEDGNIYGIDALSGMQKWAFSTGNEVLSSPAVVNDAVYVGSESSNIYSIDVLSGMQKWAFSTGDKMDSSPVVVDGIVYVGSNDKNVHAIDARSGVQKWAFLTGDVVYSSPTVMNGVVYVGSNDKNVYAIDTRSGVKKWSFHTGDAVHSSPVVVNNAVYVGSFDHKVYAFGLP